MIVSEIRALIRWTDRQHHFAISDCGEKMYKHQHNKIINQIKIPPEGSHMTACVLRCEEAEATT